MIGQTWVESFLLNLLSGFFALIAGLLVLYILWLIIVRIKIRLPKTIVLELDLTKPLVEYIPRHPGTTWFMPHKKSVYDILRAIELAGADKRVKGLVARISLKDPAGSLMGLAAVQEIRQAIAAFGKQGKFAYAFAETFGQSGSALASYYLATGFDAVYLQPSGQLNLAGMMYSAPFFRDALNRAGLQPQLDTRQEYKQFKYAFTEDGFNEPHKEAMQRLLESQYDQLLDGIAESRKMDKSALKELIDQGPFLSHQALELKLVDDLLYRDQLYEKVKAVIGDKPPVALAKYLLCRRSAAVRQAPTIALIYGTGHLHSGISRYDPMYGTFSMGSDSVTAALKAAVKNKRVKAIVLRIDSPGGSHVAGDAVWREVLAAKKSGTPVIVSMGNVAASGGYYIATAASKVLADPTTVTGSIGVGGGKMITRRFWQERIGVKWDEIHIGPNATMWSPVADFTDAQWQKLQELLDWVYDDFTRKVAHSRQMPLEEVLQLAKGRVWSGADAKKHGLVDALGGLQKAIETARTEAGLGKEVPVRVETYPRSKKFVQLIGQRISINQPPQEDYRLHFQLLQSAAKAGRLLNTLETRTEADLLLMPGYFGP